MKLKQRILIAITLICFGLIATSPTHAGVYTDDLTRCIIETTSTKDRIEFVKWMFLAMSKHPAVQSFSSVSEKQIEEANQKVADLFVKLLTVTCKEKAEKALKYEGQFAIQTSFKVLGTVAAQELFTDPNVSGVMSGLDKYIDSDKLNFLLKKQ